MNSSPSNIIIISALKHTTFGHESPFPGNWEHVNHADPFGGKREKGHVLGGREETASGTGALVSSSV